MAIAEDTSDFFSECLDHVRWISALVVLTSHARNAIFIPFIQIQTPTAFDYVFYGITNLQNEAVICFFVISGYLIGGKLLNYYRNSHVPVVRYIINRLVRLYIVLIPSLVLAFIVQSGGYCKPKDPTTWAGNLFFLQDILVDTVKCNEPLWSLANEFWYYAIGLLVVVFLVKSRSIAAVGLVACLSLLLLDDIDSHHVLLYFSVWVGGLCLVWSGALSRLDLGMPVSVGVLLVGLAISRSHLIDDLFLLRDLFIGFGVFLVLLSARNSRAGVVVPRFARFMAAFSFSLYLTHWSILAVLKKLLPKVNLHAADVSTLLIYLAVCFACLSFAFVFAWLTERNTGYVRTMVTKALIGKSLSKP